MNLKSYFKKSISLLSTRFIYARNFIYPNLYLFNLKKQDLPNVKRIIFYFATEEYMHLGDHLFFLPLITTLINSGYTVTVAPTKIMTPLFAKLGIPLYDGTSNLSDYDLVVSRIELITKLVKYKSLLVNISRNLSMPVCDQLLHDFSQLFNLKPYQEIDFDIFKDKQILGKLQLTQNKKLILFNSYCDSSAFLINKAKKRLLLDQLTEYADNEDYVIVFTGSQADKENDKNNYPFNFVDLRGKTSVLDIFALVALDNTQFYIGFDAFIMHVFSLFKKNSFVVFRGRLIKKQSDMLKKYHVNLFKAHSYVQLIN